MAMWKSYPAETKTQGPIHVVLMCWFHQSDFRSQRSAPVRRHSSQPEAREGQGLPCISKSVTGIFFLKYKNINLEISSDSFYLYSSDSVGPSQPLIMVTVMRKKTAFYEVDTSSRPYLQEGLHRLVDTRLKYYKRLYILNDSDVSARGGMNKNTGGHLIEIPATLEFFLLPWVRNVAFLTLSRHSTRERKKGSIEKQQKHAPPSPARLKYNTWAKVPHR